MKSFFIVLIYIVVCWSSHLAFGQATHKHAHHEHEASPLESVAILKVKARLNTSKNQAKFNDIIAALELNDYDFKLDTIIESRSGMNYRFTQHVHRFPVFANSGIATLYKDGNIEARITLINPDSILWEADATIQNTNASYVWFIENKKAHLCKVVHYVEAEIHKYRLIDSHGHVVYEGSNTVFHKRASANALIYLPNPITSAETTYGGNYIDNNDQTNPFLDAERVLKQITVNETGGIYQLNNDYVLIREHSPPVIQPETSTDGNFFYDRSESGFEDVNTLYHITTFQEYIQSLGFNNLVNYQLAVDCHGFNGQDQSAFFPSTNPPQLTFGTGGVDDAEDADVIIHEYGHAISHSAAPNTNIGTQRGALDEAIGDYLAVSYSRLHHEHDWFKVFNWDGHNEFWSGRLAQTTKIYPEDLDFNIYGDAPFFSSTLMEIEDLIGRDTTHILLFESLYWYTTHMKISDAIDLLLRADSVLFGEAHKEDILNIAVARGLSVGGTTFLQNIETGVKSFYLLNSYAYSQGAFPLEIICKDGEFRYTLYNPSGKKVILGEAEHRVLVHPGEWPSGIHFLELQSDREKRVFKVINP